jgi:hypothetical protein
VKSGRLPIRRLLAGEGGIALVGVLLAVAVLSVLAASVSALASGESRATPFWRDRGEAFYVAESGLNHCLWKMKYDMANVTGVQGVYPNDPSTFTSDASESTGVMSAGKSYEVWVKLDAVDAAKATVTARGKANNRSYILKTTVHQKNTPFQKPNNEGVSEVDPTILLTPPPHTDPAEDWIILSNPVTKVAGTYVIRNLDSAGNGPLIFTGDAVVWVEGNFSCRGDGVINPDGDELVPAADRHTVVFYVVGQGVTITLLGSTDFNAFIYAPFTSISVTGQADVFGGLAGSSVTISGSADSTANPDGENIGFPPDSKVTWLVELWGQ